MSKNMGACTGTGQYLNRYIEALVRVGPWGLKGSQRDRLRRASPMVQDFRLRLGMDQPADCATVDLSSPFAVNEGRNSGFCANGNPSIGRSILCLNVVYY